MNSAFINDHEKSLQEERDGPGIRQDSLCARQGSLPIADSIEEYLIDGEAAGLSAATLSTRRPTLKQMQVWCRQNGVTTLEALTTAVGKKYLIAFARTPSPNTGKIRSDLSVRSAAVIIKGWLRWAYDQRQIEAERLYK